MSDSFTIQQNLQTVVLNGGVLQPVTIGQPLQTLTITTAGSPGPRGLQGPKGDDGGDFDPSGLQGEINALEADLTELNDAPDFAAIFRNALI